ncbi:hypothetical protein NIK97_18550 [Brucella pseudintermedia]|uniref:Uncharacterized protein n=1 Tax=Brucella pseudintermedia TaxID=370111 RepID=A0ABY5UHP1_9HYPH|nr:hypothetical protein [Brucella pseudintermedia]UWL61877.1 hypothetical protein NIK97_18550 [Brucella pseudintermedia]
MADDRQYYLGADQHAEGGTIRALLPHLLLTPAHRSLSMNRKAMTMLSFNNRSLPSEKDIP